MRGAGPETDPAGGSRSKRHRGVQAYEGLLQSLTVLQRFDKRNTLSAVKGREGIR